MPNRPNQDSIHIRNTVDFVTILPAPVSSICLVFIKTTTYRVRELPDPACKLAELQELEHAHPQAGFAQ